MIPIALTSPIKLRVSFALILICCFPFSLPSSLFANQPEKSPFVDIVAMDPPTSAVLGTNDRLHLRIRYESKIPLRFQAGALRQGIDLEVGLNMNPAHLHAPGTGEALAWLSFSNPTRIDEVKLKVLDIEWREIATLKAAADVTWKGLLADHPRETADWVKALVRSEKRNLDFVYDPIPDKEELYFDIIFIITVGSTPAYFLLQIFMLRNYRGRWRELAAIPVVSVVPLIFYTVIGFGVTFHQLVAFIFRCMPFALAYLVTLWVIKRLRTKDSPPAGN